MKCTPNRLPIHSSLVLGSLLDETHLSAKLQKMHHHDVCAWWPSSDLVRHAAWLLLGITRPTCKAFWTRKAQYTFWQRKLRVEPSYVGQEGWEDRAWTLLYFPFFSFPLLGLWPGSTCRHPCMFMPNATEILCCIHYKQRKLRACNRALLLLWHKSTHILFPLSTMIFPTVRAALP